MAKYYQLVAPSAIYETKVPFPKRNKLAAKMMEQCFNQLSDCFVGKKGPNARKTGSVIRSVLDGVKIIITKNKEKNYIAQMGYTFSKKAKRMLGGFTVQIPFATKAKTLAVGNFHCVMHEINHTVEHALNPKYTARTNRSYLEGKFKGLDHRIGDYDRFYLSVLYDDERSPKDLSLARVNPKKARRERIYNIEKGIREVFSDPKISSNEKIQMLQDWRYSLMREKKAYTAQVLYQNKMEFKKKLVHHESCKDELREYYKKKTAADTRDLVEDHRFYSAKIAVVSKLLREEIADHRQKHAQSLRQTKS